MPGRTNDFQELITLLVQILGEDRATPSAMVRSTVPGVGKREIDIRVEAEVDGVPFYIGIEASASKSRRKSVEWVERMRGKHEHLSTSKLVLVSSSGFTKGALALAHHHGIVAITPGVVTDGFVGDVVNKLASLRTGVLTIAAETITLHIDPPIGKVATVPIPIETAAKIAVHGPDSVCLCGLDALIEHWVREKIDPSGVNMRDLENAKRDVFTLTQSGPIINGVPIYVIGDVIGDDSDTSTTLRKITQFEIAGRFELSWIEMELEHGHFVGTNFSHGTAVLDGNKFHWAIVEDGKRIGTRVAPVDRPLDAKAFRSIGGKRMSRVNEGPTES
ncbi:hypothetical protein BKG59_19470 [Mycobacteroides chelonae]|jgi:hypothetical protein|nr:hypothetical protein BKG63_22260 [Mycobacteroides chelonae]OHT99312.1 hypothetical protein BKG72_02380 [Mycobacteroides chelonae]OLT86070.1 hypothetical protein BKG59_19470 [Mycobacteroides chelonae]